MAIFTLTWLAEVTDPISAYWTANFYRNMIGEEKLAAVKDDDSLT